MDIEIRTRNAHNNRHLDGDTRIHAHVNKHVQTHYTDPNTYEYTYTDVDQSVR